MDDKKPKYKLKTVTANFVGSFENYVEEAISEIEADKGIIMQIETNFAVDNNDMYFVANIFYRK